MKRGKNREIKMEITVNADTRECNVKGPLEYKELCMEILDAARKTINEAHARRGNPTVKSPIIVPNDPTSMAD